MSEENKNTLRQADNRVEIEGLLLEKRIEEREINSPDGKKNAITGEIDIETAENEVHTLRVFSYQLKNDGTENSIFKGLKTVSEEYKSVAEVGRDEADKVRTTAGQIGLNEYYGQDGQLRSFPQLSTNFLNRVKADEEYNPKAEFEVEVIVAGISPEIKNEEETGRAKLKTYIPLYGGKIIPFEFIVADEGAVSYIEDNYEKGETVKIYGDIINFKEKKVIEEQVAFGKPKEKITYNTIREYVVTGGSEPYDDEEKAYDMETVKKALTEREVYLEELKNKKKVDEKKEGKKGFDTKASKESSDKKKALDNLPF